MQIQRKHCDHLPREIERQILAYMPAHNISSTDLAEAIKLMDSKRHYFWSLLHFKLKLAGIEWWSTLGDDIADGALCDGVGEVG